MDPDLDQAVEQLGAPRSRERRPAAKRLRELGDPAAGPALLQALRAEVQDERTWETQYQMIMALGACRHEPAVPFLRELAGGLAEDLMVGTALGHALTRLEWMTGTDLPTLDAAMTAAAAGDAGQRSVTGGGLRAVAMLGLEPDRRVRDRILSYALHTGVENHEHVIAAAAGWSGPTVDHFLEVVASSLVPHVVEAGAAAAAGRRRTFTSP